MPAPTARARDLRLAEALLFVVVAALSYHDIHDPARVLAWLFGPLPARPLAHLHPWLALERGIGNVFLVAVLASAASRARAAEYLRRAAVAWFVLVVAVVPTLAQIEIRRHVDEAPGNRGPYRSNSHDGGVLQTEMAVDLLLDGEDPYGAEYARPPMSRARDSDEEGWRSIGYEHNPAFDHLPYLPGVLYVSTPPQWLAQRVLGFWDERFLYLAAALVLAGVLGRMAPAGAARRMVVLVTLCTPLLAPFLVAGRNDVLLLVPLAFFARALAAERWRAAAVALGCAATIKQFALFPLPFFLLFAHLRAGRDARATLRRTWPALALPIAAALPFLVWDARAFVDDVLVFNLGGEGAYPLRWDGFGLSPLAYGLGLVDSPAGGNPLGWLAVPALLVALVALSVWLVRGPCARRALLASGGLLYLALFTSRFFADNYLAAPLLLWAVAWKSNPAYTSLMTPFAPQFDTLVSMFKSSVAQYGDRPLFGQKRGGEWQWLTYAQAGKLVDDFRGGLASLGVTRGDRVAVISNNRLEWFVGAYASHGLGAAYAPMYEAQLDKEWKYILKDSGAKVCLIATAGAVERVRKLQADLPDLVHLIPFEGDDPLSYARVLEKGAQAPVPAITPDGKDVANLTYTSGTTGNPKGVRLTHANLASNISATREVLPLGTGDRSLAFLPWAHVFGGSIEIGTLISVGAQIAICEAPEKIVEDLAGAQPTILLSVPRIWNKIYDGVKKMIASKPKAIQALFAAGMRARTDMRNGKTVGLVDRFALPVAEILIFQKIRNRFGGRLKYAVSGAAALSREVAEFIDNLSITVYEGYGMTETSGSATANTPVERRIGSVGKALPGVRIDLDHQASGSDADNGEIIVHGHCVMDGYHNLPEETAKVMTPDGGMRTGDLGRFDKDGFLYITGRVKELYKLENGKYVAPALLEEQITLSPFIAQALVDGSDKPYNVALIVPDLPVLKEWAKGAGVPSSSTDELLGDERTRKLIEGELARYSEEFKAFEKVKHFKLVGEEFSTANDLLTPTLKVKRRNVLARYGKDLNELYRG